MALYNNSEEKKADRFSTLLPLISKGGILGSIVGIIYVIVIFFDEKFLLLQILGFINTYPAMLTVVAVCISYVVVECYKQKSKTARARDNMDKVEAELRNLKEKIEELENESSEIKAENIRLIMENNKLNVELERAKQSADYMRKNKEEKRIFRKSDL